MYYKKLSILSVALITLACTTWLFEGENIRDALVKKHSAATTAEKLDTNNKKPKRAPSVVPSSNAQPVVYGQRKFPFPYQAMIAISGDADHETLRKFNLVHAFLNTYDNTPMGPGVGLDISDSFFMYNGSDMHSITDMNQSPLTHQFTYFQGTSNVPYGADIINLYIHHGWMDTMHSFGDFSMQNQHQTQFTRALATQAIHALQQSGDDIQVWVDHGNKSNVDDFGSKSLARFYRYQQGSNPNSPYYHTDMTIPYGIKFVWYNLGSSTFSRPSDIFPLQLEDGRHVWGFSRYSNIGMSKRGTVEWNWAIDDLYRQLSMQNLQRLESTHGYAVIAQHFYADNGQNPFAPGVVYTFRRLAHEYTSGRLLVARTSRLLNYNVAQKYVHYTVSYEGEKAVIHIVSIEDPVLGTHAPTLDEIRGLTFYTSNPSQTEIELNNTPLPDAEVQTNPSDGVHPSIAVKWFPPDTQNVVISVPQGMY